MHQRKRHNPQSFGIQQVITSGLFVFPGSRHPPPQGVDGRYGMINLC